jgi:hypothetical protein
VPKVWQVPAGVMGFFALQPPNKASAAKKTKIRM